MVHINYYIRHLVQRYLNIESNANRSKCFMLHLKEENILFIVVYMKLGASCE